MDKKLKQQIVQWRKDFRELEGRCIDEGGDFSSEAKKGTWYEAWELLDEIDMYVEDIR